MKKIILSLILGLLFWHSSQAQLAHVFRLLLPVSKVTRHADDLLYNGYKIASKSNHGTYTLHKHIPKSQANHLFGMQGSIHKQKSWRPLTMDELIHKARYGDQEYIVVDVPNVYSYLYEKPACYSSRKGSLSYASIYKHLTILDLQPIRKKGETSYQSIKKASDKLGLSYTLEDVKETTVLTQIEKKALELVQQLYDDMDALGMLSESYREVKIILTIGINPYQPRGDASVVDFGDFLFQYKRRQQLTGTIVDHVKKKKETAFSDLKLLGRIAEDSEWADFYKLVKPYSKRLGMGEDLAQRLQQERERLAKEIRLLEQVDSRLNNKEVIEQYKQKYAVKGVVATFFRQQKRLIKKDLEDLYGKSVESSQALLKRVLPNFRREYRIEGSIATYLREKKQQLLEDLVFFEELPIGATMDDLQQKIQNYQKVEAQEYPILFYINHKKTALKQTLEGMVWGIKGKELKKQLDLYQKIVGKPSQGVLNAELKAQLDADRGFLYVPIKGKYQAFRKRTVKLMDVEDQPIEQLSCVEVLKNSSIYAKNTKQLDEVLESTLENLKRSFDPKELSILLLTGNKDTYRVLRNDWGKRGIDIGLGRNVPKEAVAKEKWHQTLEKKLLRELKKNEGKTIFTLGHIEGASFVDRASGFKISLTKLNELAAKHQINLVHIGCTTANLPKGITTQPINTVLATEQLLKAIKTTTTFEALFVQLSKGSFSKDKTAVGLLVEKHLIDAQNFHWIQLKKKAKLGAGIGGSLAGGIYVYYTRKENN